MFVADGRFHLEAIMIVNPTVPAFRYDPYLRALTEEEYAHGEMRSVRKSMVARASRVERWGVVLGTLGKGQGKPRDSGAPGGGCGNAGRRTRCFSSRR